MAIPHYFLTEISILVWTRATIRFRNPEQLGSENYVRFPADLHIGHTPEIATGA
jgi:hypothetical protein